MARALGLRAVTRALRALRIVGNAAAAVAFVAGLLGVVANADALSPPSRATSSAKPLAVATANCTHPRCLPVKFVEPGWTNVCAQPGMLVCDNFSDAATLDGTLYAGAAMPHVEAGNLVFDIPSRSRANAGGQYRVTFPPIGEGGFLAFSYRVKADAATLALPERKEFILWRGSMPCTDLDLVQTSSPIATPYTECGRSHFGLPLGPSHVRWHYPDYNCDSQGIKTSYDGCAITHADQWENFYFELKIGTYGQPDSRVVMWHKTDGGVWKRYIERNDFTFRGDGGFDQFMLTVYMTNKNPTIAHPPGKVVYDYLLMSSRPFSVDGLLGRQ